MNPRMSRIATDIQDTTRVATRSLMAVLRLTRRFNSHNCAEIYRQNTWESSRGNQFRLVWHWSLLFCIILILSTISSLLQNSKYYLTHPNCTITPHGHLSVSLSFLQPATGDRSQWQVNTILNGHMNKYLSACTVWGQNQVLSVPRQVCYQQGHYGTFKVNITPTFTKCAKVNWSICQEVLNFWLIILSKWA